MSREKKTDAELLRETIMECTNHLTDAILTLTATGRALMGEVRELRGSVDSLRDSMEDAADDQADRDQGVEGASGLDDLPDW